MSPVDLGAKSASPAITYLRLDSQLTERVRTPGQDNFNMPVTALYITRYRSDHQPALKQCYPSHLWRGENKAKGNVARKQVMQIYLALCVQTKL